MSKIYKTVFATFILMLFTNISFAEDNTLSSVVQNPFMMNFYLVQLKEKSTEKDSDLYVMGERVVRESIKTNSTVNELNIEVKDIEEEYKKLQEEIEVIRRLEGEVRNIQAKNEKIRRQNENKKSTSKRFEQIEFRNYQDNESRRINILKNANTRIGSPYIFGASGNNGTFDCSSFTQKMYSYSGINLPRTANEQYKRGRTTNSPKYGDLVFFEKTYNGPPITHVGIYIGGDKMIHAGSNTGVIIESFMSNYFKSKFVGFKTYF